MDAYKAVSRQLYEALEEMYLLKEECHLTFEQDGQRRTLLNTRLIDLHEEEEGEYLTTDRGLRLRLDQLVALNGKPAQFWV